MDAVRQLTQLTLSRREWVGVARALRGLPRVEESCGPAMAELQASLEQQRCGAEEPVSIRQSPIQWSPLVLGLAVRVLQQPELLPVVEQLRDQMEMQARKIDGLMAMDESPNTVSWQQVQASDPSEAAGSN